MCFNHDNVCVWQIMFQVVLQSCQAMRWRVPWKSKKQWWSLCGKIMFCSWKTNIHTVHCQKMLHQWGQIENIKQEMNGLNINILEVCEIKWANNEDFLNISHCHYASVEKNERGVQLILDKDLKECFLGYDRIILIKLKGKSFNISVIVVYVQSTGEIDNFYSAHWIMRRLNKYHRNLPSSWEIWIPKLERNERAK